MTLTCTTKFRSFCFNNFRYKILKSTEIIYNLVKHSLVSPYALAENLVCYSLSNSALVTDINGHTSPAGGYDFVRKWMKEEAKEVAQLPSSDLAVAFDNDQVIGKSWHVRPNNKVSSSVVTSTLVASIDGTVQNDRNLMPGGWMSSKQLCDFEQSLVATQQEKTLLNEELIRTLDHRIGKLQKQIRDAEGVLRDHIDDQVDKLRENKEWKQCMICGERNGIRWHKCHKCKASLKDAINSIADKANSVEPPPKKKRGNDKTFMKTIKINDDFSVEVDVKIRDSGVPHVGLYQHITSNHQPIRLQVCDPAFVNPNSYDRVRAVLRHIGKVVGISRYESDGQRRWCSVFCDGLPYVLALKVIKETLVCSCGEIVYGQMALERHQQEHHHNGHDQEFDWVLLQIGLGHVEMNFARSFLELNWDVSTNLFYQCDFLFQGGRDRHFLHRDTHV